MTQGGKPRSAPRSVRLAKVVVHAAQKVLPKYLPSVMSCITYCPQDLPTSAINLSRCTYTGLGAQAPITIYVKCLPDDSNCSTRRYCPRRYFTCYCELEALLTKAPTKVFAQSTAHKGYCLLSFRDAPTLAWVHRRL